jgi:hypothetical protein
MDNADRNAWYKFLENRRINLEEFTMKRIAVFMLALGTTFMVGGASIAEDKKFASQLGRWNMNMEETIAPSEFITAPTEPFEVTFDDGNALHFTAYKTTPNGLEVAFKYEGFYDGKPYPAGETATASYHHLTATSFYTETRLPNGMVFSEHGYITDEGAKMRLEGKAIGDDGKLFEYVWVLDKE